MLRMRRGLQALNIRWDDIANVEMTDMSHEGVRWQLLTIRIRPDALAYNRYGPLRWRAREFGLSSVGLDDPDGLLETVMARWGASRST
jgi:hypothetical protein